MWVKWVTIHESYGFPQIAQELRGYLELRGITVRLVSKRGKGTGNLYQLQVPKTQLKQAEQYRDAFKSTWQ